MTIIWKPGLSGDTGKIIGNEYIQWKFLKAASACCHVNFSES